VIGASVVSTQPESALVVDAVLGGRGLVLEQDPVAVGGGDAIEREGRASGRERDVGADRGRLDRALDVEALGAGVDVGLGGGVLRVARVGQAGDLLVVHRPRGGRRGDLVEAGGARHRLDGGGESDGAQRAGGRGGVDGHRVSAAWLVAALVRGRGAGV
jgi:hypothetical protein